MFLVLWHLVVRCLVGGLMCGLVAAWDFLGTSVVGVGLTLSSGSGDRSRSGGGGGGGGGGALRNAEPAKMR